MFKTCCPLLPCSLKFSLCFYLPICVDVPHPLLPFWALHCIPRPWFLGRDILGDMVGQRPRGSGVCQEEEGMQRGDCCRLCFSEQTQSSFSSDTAARGWVSLHHGCKMRVSGWAAWLHIWWEGNTACLRVWQHLALQQTALPWCYGGTGPSCCCVSFPFLSGEKSKSNFGHQLLLLSLLLQNHILDVLCRWCLKETILMWVTPCKRAVLAGICWLVLGWAKWALGALRSHSAGCSYRAEHLSAAFITGWFFSFSEVTWIFESCLFTS